MPTPATNLTIIARKQAKLATAKQLKQKFADNEFDHQVNQRRLVMDICDLVGVTEAAQVLGLDRKTIYNKYLERQKAQTNVGSIS